MNVLLFGATGMVGQGVLRESLLDGDVRLVQTVGRTATSVQNPKLREIVHQDLLHYEAIESDLSGFERLLLLPGCIVQWDEGSGLLARDLRNHHGRRRGFMPA